MFQFSFHNKMKRYLVFNPPKRFLKIFSDHNAGLPISIYFAMSVSLAHRGCSLFCTQLGYKIAKRLLEGVSFCYFLNLITLHAPHLKEALVLLALLKSAAFIWENHLCSESFTSTYDKRWLCFKKNNKIWQQLKKCRFFAGTT